ncbi:Xaa-Pro aminopeptidase [Hathewaya proteolytica DSM 3090]|uniref:Xaa-Pro aminopeptidase n=1 Tax=Hathewaya proteolytica DSM 3090 TaxID=1121331 RepID=A0A1M6PGV7_9CLOT|nr:Xaa-Pro peptidase family protein [Hathewaya proteolytica]SHK07181.1 Xaa-Pro aminopeptidase [Hathewaya proteolytica DSM 3090]
MDRLENLRKNMKKLALDAVIVYKLPNVRYFSGYTDEEAYLLITEKENYFLTDPRFTEQAGKQCPQYKVMNHREFSNLGQCIAELLKGQGIIGGKVGFEENSVSYGLYNNIKLGLGDVELLPLCGMLDKLRYVKDEHEIACARRAAEISDKAFDQIIKFVKPGMTENEVALQLEYYMRKEGAEGVAFDTILISGAKSSLLHGKPDEKVIENGDFLLMDFGALYKGYRSDMTRTIMIGNPDEKQKEIYDMVLKAEVAAVATVKAGVTSEVPDAAARKECEKYIEYYYQGIGHGVGLELHEEPFISHKGGWTFEKNCVITVEPGLYIPGWGGVRIEDTVIVTENGCEILTKAPKELIIVNN